MVIMMLDNKKIDNIIGILIQKILDLEKYKKILYLKKLIKLCHLKDKMISFHKLGLLKLI